MDDKLRKIKANVAELNTNPLDQICGDGSEVYVGKMIGSSDLEKCEKFWSFEKHASHVMIYMLIGLLLTDLLLLSELFIHDEEYGVKMHLVRILILVSLIVLGILSFSIGHRNAPVPINFDLFCKLMTFIIIMIYLVSMVRKYQENPTQIGLITVVGGAGIALLCLFSFVSTFWNKINGMTHLFLSQLPFVFWGVVGIGLSGLYIYKVEYLHIHPKNHLSLTE